MPKSLRVRIATALLSAATLAATVYALAAPYPSAG